MLAIVRTELNKYILDPLINLVIGYSFPEQRQQLPTPHVSVFRQPPTSIWSNFGETCELMDRNPVEVKMFVCEELDVRSAELVESTLVLKACVEHNNVKRCLNLYVNKFLKCKSCKTTATRVVRKGRVYVVRCYWCGAEQNHHGVGE